MPALHPPGLEERGTQVIPDFKRVSDSLPTFPRLGGGVRNHGVYAGLRENSPWETTGSHFQPPASVSW